MKNIILLIAILFLDSYSFGQAPKRTTIPEYITKYKEDAIKDMMKMGVPASITLAQGILESESGNSALAKEANNHFGIKCHKDWTGETFHQDDDTRDECFRKYNHVLESYDDHGRFLRDRSRYAFLFDYEIQDYKSWARGLKSAGYATNPRYAELLIKLIEEYDLHQFDLGGKKIPVTIATPPVLAAQTKDSKSQKTVKPKTNHKPSRQHSAKVQKPSTAKNGNLLRNANGVPFTIAEKNDSWLSVAMANDMRLWQILKYNDANADDNLNVGDMVYLKPKRGTPSQPYHVVAEGENLWQISQIHGVKLKKLIKLNHLTESVAVKTGQKIQLR
ncbi:MAG: glucosaminidase domain-containing protein [Bacteroidetes bacterium]|nr:glucosaminidase domain-containing protein [Bacteroidota bacterium]